MSPIRLIEVPYDSGRRDRRMGSGPLALTNAGAAARLRADGHHVSEHTVKAASGWRSETVTAFELQRSVAVQAAQARAAGQFPLLLAGNCNTTVGMLAGVRPNGMVWFDGHGDFNTPDSSLTGYLDGQCLAMATGRCWQTAIATVPGFKPVDDDTVLLIGAHSLDNAEEVMLHESGILWLGSEQARKPELPADVLSSWHSRVANAHIHIDLDVYDTSIAPANSYAVPGGLLADDVHRAIAAVAEQTAIVSATLAGYDPRYDQNNRLRDTALDVLALLADLGTVQFQPNR